MRNPSASASTSASTTPVPSRPLSRTHTPLAPEAPGNPLAFSTSIAPCPRDTSTCDYRGRCVLSMDSHRSLATRRKSVRPRATDPTRYLAIALQLIWLLPLCLPREQMVPILQTVWGRVDHPLGKPKMSSTMDSLVTKKYVSSCGHIRGARMVGWVPGERKTDWGKGPEETFRGANFF